MERLVAWNRRVLLQSLPLSASNGLNALRKFTEHTNQWYNQWHKEWEKEQRLNPQIDLRDQLQSILLNSTFISCVAFFETQFRIICEILQTDKHRLEDAKGKSSIQKFHNFISKQIRVKLTAKDKLFERLILYNKIRNKIVHEQSSIQGEPDLVRDLVKNIRKMKNIEIEESYGYFELKISDCNFIYDYIEITKEYLKFVTDEILKQLLPSEVIYPTRFTPNK